MTLKLFVAYIAPFYMVMDNPCPYYRPFRVTEEMSQDNRFIFVALANYAMLSPITKVGIVFGVPIEFEIVSKARRDCFLKLEVWWTSLIKGV